MKEARLTWQERPSNSEFVASVWVCTALAATTRITLADPCIALSLVTDGDNRQVILRGPETKPRNEHLAPGYAATTIRLQVGVILRGFLAQDFINRSLVLPVDAESRFWLAGTRLQFPSFNNAELLINQLHKLGYLRYSVPGGSNAQNNDLSARSYARLIKRTTGLSPYQLHQLQRTHQALRLLKQGMPATAVAAELNFVDQSHLTHAAKQFLGHTPKQLRYVPQSP